MSSLQSLHGRCEMQYLLSYQQTKMSHLSVIPDSPNVNFWSWNVLGAMPFATQRITGIHRWMGLVISLRQAIMYVYSKKKKKKKGLKSHKQIQCKFKSNSSRLQIHFFPITLSFTESFCNKKSRIWASLGPETMCGISAGKPWVWAEFKPEHMDWSPNLRWMISVVTTSLSCGKE